MMTREMDECTVDTELRLECLAMAIESFDHSPSTEMLMERAEAIFRFASARQRSAMKP